MARRRLLSRDLEKMLEQLKVLMSHYDIKGTREVIELERLLSDWRISCMVEEELTPKGTPISYRMEYPEEFIEFREV